VERVLVGMLTGGHVLLEGVPGLAKTLAVRTVADALEGRFSRVQFTPDLLPADVVGTQVYDPRSQTFSVKQGPVFANLVLADEVNRAPAKVQSALLEAMQERQVTIGDQTFPLPDPFIVLATQNPIEQEGTYPLPEAQLDRFMFYVNVTYPSASEEMDIVRSTTVSSRPALKRVLSPHKIRELQDLVLRVPAADHVIQYAVNLVRATRPNEEGAADFVKEHVSWGAGPRASQYLVLGAKSRAILDGRMAASVEDVKALAENVLVHRVITNFRAESDGITSAQLVERLLEQVKV
jgi:MoxR-like ATPase